MLTTSLEKVFSLTLYYGYYEVNNLQLIIIWIQDARRRKLDSGRVDAEAVIDELMEVKKKHKDFQQSVLRQEAE